MAIPPSSNIPSLQDIQEQYRKAAERARGRNVAAPFAAATGEMARGRAMELEALNRQQIQSQRQQQAMSRDTGMEMLGGNMAGEQRFQQAVAAGGQRYNQAASQLGIQQAQAEQARDARADAMDLQATGVGVQAFMQQAQQGFQREMANAKMAYQVNRDKQQYDLAVKNAERNYRATVWDAKMKEMSLASRLAQSRENIAASRQGRGAGGGRMTASYSSGAPNFQSHLAKMMGSKGVMG